MKTFFKIAFFFLVFSLGFFALRMYAPVEYYNVQILVADLGGLTYLYSTVSVIFAIFAAFAILSQVERWNNLTDAIKKESGALKELYFWSLHIADEGLKNKFKDHITQYLETIRDKEFFESGIGAKHAEIDQIVELLHNDIYDTQTVSPNLMPIGFATFTDLMKARDERIHHASTTLPRVLKNTLLFNDWLLVGLSLLIGVRSIVLDYIFVISIAVLCYVIYMVVDDLDHPMQSGNWQMTPKDYQEVLEYMR